MPARTASPCVLAMLICDAIHRDRGTGKHTLLGTFSSIAGVSFPIVHPGMAVFIAVTDGRGKTTLRLKLVPAEDGAAIFDAPMEVEFKDPRAVVEMAAAIQNVKFERAGEYRLQLFAGETLLMERRLAVMQAVQRPASPYT